MHYYLYKLNFPYGVHFGADKAGISLEKTSPNCHCDTLYSAICHEILKLHGEDGLKEFYNSTVKGEFLLTDLLPYKGEELMIPKPILYIEATEDIQVNDSVKKKKMKKLKFLPISKLQEFFDGNADSIDFAHNVMYDKCAPSRSRDDKENGLYSVGVTKFADDCGLYFIAKLPEDKKDWFDNIIKSLALSGIGGKRTSGYGKFRIVDDFEITETSGITSEKELAQMLNNGGKHYLSLSAFYPKKEEINKLKNGYCSFVRRQGFVQSTTYSDTMLKKLPTTMVSAGSCFEDKFEGDVVDVSKDGNHPVYRYGKPIMIGIDV